MRKTYVVTLVAIVLAISGVGSQAMRASAAAQDDSSKITITAPTEGQSIIDSNVQIIGTAPAGLLVDVDIIDTDTNKPLIEHQAYGQVDGSVTSDQNGRWVFTPQQQLVPGQFSVQAYYTTANNQKVNSPTIHFVVITAQGSSERLSQSTIRGLFTIGGGVVLLIIWLIAHLIRRARRRRVPTTESAAAKRDLEDEAHEHRHEQEQDASHEYEPGRAPHSLFLKTDEGRAKMKELEDEARKIEEELSRTAEELERANTAVIELHDEIRGQEEVEDDKHKKG